jgi:hypothetical protein
VANRTRKPSARRSRWRVGTRTGKDESGSDVQVFGFSLGLDKDKPKQSAEGETLRAQRCIGAKVFGDSKRPIKFPEPADAVNMVMADARGYLGSGIGDGADWHQIVSGARGLWPELVQHWVDPKTGSRRRFRACSNRGVLSGLRHWFSSACTSSGSSAGRTSGLTSSASARSCAATRRSSSQRRPLVRR